MNDPHEAWRRYGYDPARPVGREHEIPNRLIKKLARAPLVEETLVLPDPARSRTELSRRELEVIRYFSRGLQGSMVADALALDLETVRTHMKSARFKLRAKNTAHACCEALRRNLID